MAIFHSFLYVYPFGVKPVPQLLDLLSQCQWLSLRKDARAALKATSPGDARVAPEMVDEADEPPGSLNHPTYGMWI